MNEAQKRGHEMAAVERRGQWLAAREDFAAWCRAVEEDNGREMDGDFREALWRPFYAGWRARKERAA